MSNHKRGEGQDPDNDWFYTLFDIPALMKKPIFSYLIGLVLIIALAFVVVSTI